SYDSIINKINRGDKKVLIKKALSTYDCKKQQPGNYDYYDFATSLYIPTKIMIQENYAPFVQQSLTNPQLQLYVSKLLWPVTYAETEAMFNIIVQYATRFI